MALEMRRWNNLVALRMDSGKSIAFHTERMELADLDDEAWEAFPPHHRLPVNVSELSVAAHELAIWSEENASFAKKETPYLPGAGGYLDQNLDSFEVSTFSLNLSQICNLRCTYCGAGDGSYGSQKFRADPELVTKQLKGFISRLSPGKTFTVQFVGGEPLLFPQDLFAITQSAKELALESSVNVQFSVVTNGTRIDKKMAQFLGQESFQVSLSWDGPSDVQNQFRPGKSGGESSKEVEVGIEHLQSVRSELRSLHVNSVMGKHNQDVVKSYQFLKSYDFDLYNFGFAAEAEDQLASKNYVQNMKNLADLVYEREGLNSLARILPFGRFLRALDDQTPVKNFCGAGKSFVHSDTKGHLYACNWFSGISKERLGYLDEIEASPRSGWLKPLTQKHNCGSCWARSLCGGGCAFVFKTKTGAAGELRDETFCERIVELAAICVFYYGKELSKQGQ